MAIPCYLIGAVMLLGFSGAGYFLGDWLLSYPVLLNMFHLTEASRWVFTGAGVAVGVILGLNWVVLGLNCRNIKKLQCRRKKCEE